MHTLLILIPLAPWHNIVLLIVRLIVGGIFFYYAIEKIKNPKQNIRDFKKNRFEPAWLWADIVLATEFLGSLSILTGVFVSIAATAIGFEMFMGTLVKKFKWKTNFTDYSYDILVFGLCLVLLAFGSGIYSLAYL